MRIVVLGASKGTGAEAVKSGLARGHTMTAFSRHPDRLALSNPALEKRSGDFHDRDSVSQAVTGQDAVLVTASTTLLGFRRDPTFFSRGTAYVIDAMKAHGVRRLVVLSALFSGESRKLAGFLVDKLVLSFLLRLPFEDHGRQEKLVRESGLEWVIARPGGLTNGRARRRYVATAEVRPVPSFISRADVGEFLVRAAEGDADRNPWVGKAVQLGG